MLRSVNGRQQSNFVCKLRKNREYAITCPEFLTPTYSCHGHMSRCQNEPQKLVYIRAWETRQGSAGERRRWRREKKRRIANTTCSPTAHLRPNSAQAATSHGSSSNAPYDQAPPYQHPHSSAPAGMTGGTTTTQVSQEVLFCPSGGNVSRTTQSTISFRAVGLHHHRQRLLIYSSRTMWHTNCICALL